MSNVTLGEALSRRKLKTYMEGSTEKYVPGQGKVSKLSEDDVIVSYVDLYGSITILPCERRDGEWFQRGVVIIATSLDAELRHIPRQTPLGGIAKTLLDAAYGHKEEAPRPSDRTEGEPQPQDPESVGPASGAQNPEE